MNNLGDILCICCKHFQYYPLKQKKALLPGVKLHLSTLFYVSVKEDAMDFEDITTETLTCIQTSGSSKQKAAWGPFFSRSFTTGSGINNVGSFPLLITTFLRAQTRNKAKIKV